MKQTKPAESARVKPAAAQRRGAWLRLLAVFAFVWIYTELCLHVLIFGAISKRIIYPVLFGLAAACGCSALCVGLPRNGQRILGTLLVVLAVLWAEVQYMYQAIFGALLPLANLTLGGNVEKFKSQLFFSMGQNVLQILALLVPLPVWILLLCLKRAKVARVRGGGRQVLLSLAAGLLCCLLVFGVMFLSRDAVASVYDQFNSPETTTTISYRNVGMVGTTLSELRFRFFPKDSRAVLKTDAPWPAEKPDPALWNVEDLDFRIRAEATEDEQLQTLDRYFANTEPTPKNQYTGLLKDFNVIVVCAESWSSRMLSPELTPTLYKLSNEGFVFKNFYGCFNSVTTNGEYATCMGLLPDLSRTKTDSSFDAAIGHYLPFCLGNALKEQGYETLAYHNYIGEFYNRYLTHPNMGYTFKSTSDGLEKITTQWPASDLEMMQISAEDFSDLEQPFHAYYMTFSGHYQYNWKNAMSAKNQSRVMDLPYSDTVKAYIACNLELEDAMKALMDRLEAAGKLDHTLIVLTNDHYPYGLSAEEYSELAGEDVDTSFEKFHNSFICWTSALKEPVVVEDYCCTVDILPTVLNLLGVEYDSRLLAGRDVLSDTEHVAILETGSFLTKGFRFDNETGEVLVHQGSEAPSGPEVRRLRSLVSQRMEFSREILNLDYYAHAFGVQSPGKNNSFRFEDITRIYDQSAVIWAVNHSFMDPVSETVFGGKWYCSLGECLDSWYRIEGSPAVSPDALPAGYAARQNDPARLAQQPESELAPQRVPFDESYPYYDAICWGFASGVIREGDRTTGHDDPVSYLDMSLMIGRLCELNGVKPEIRSYADEEVEKRPEERLAEARELAPDLTEEELRYVIWVHDEEIIFLDQDAMEQLRQVSAPLTRVRVCFYLFRTCTYELDRN